jgi:hypothetical protein
VGNDEKSNDHKEGNTEHKEPEECMEPEEDHHKNQTATTETMRTTTVGMTGKMGTGTRQDRRGQRANGGEITTTMRNNGNENHKDEARTRGRQGKG